jgi:hypothetical protein
VNGQTERGKTRPVVQETNWLPRSIEKGERVKTYRKTAITVGVLFIVGTAAGFLSGVFGPDLKAQNYLSTISSNESKVIIGALLEFLMAIAVVSIAVAIFPVLKRLNESFALGYVVARTVEGLLFTIAVISLLTLLTLGRQLPLAASPAVSYFQTLGTLLLAVREWGGGVCSAIVFSLGSLMFYYVLYKSSLIPRWLSGWGLIGATLYFASGFLPLLGHDPRSTIYVLMEAPLALNEMALAVLLIAKGFNVHAIAALTEG